MKRQSALLWRLYRLPGPGFWRHGALAFFAGLAIVLYNLVTANALRGVFAAATAGSTKALGIQIMLFALSVCGFFLYNCTTWGLFVASTARITGRIRKALFRHLCALPAAAVEQDRDAAAMALFTADAAAVENAFGYLLRFTVASALSGLTATTLLLAQNPALGLIILGTGAMQLACNLIAVRPLQALSRRIAHQIEETTAAMQCLLDGAVTIRLYGMEREMLAAYHRQSLQLQALNRRLALVEAAIKGGNVVVAMLSYLLILAAGAWMASSGLLTVPELLFLTQIRGMVMLVVFSLGDFAQQSQPALASAERLFTFLDKPAEMPHDTI